MALTIAAAALAVTSFLLTAWQWMAARRFPLHQRQAGGTFRPPVTLLKPLKGCDHETETCLRSWFEQEYSGPVQILLGVASRADPVCALVRQLLAEYKRADATLVLCDQELGPNAKVSTLAQLETRAEHELIVISDADVWAPPDLLANLVAPLQTPGVGLVNCLYRLANPVTPAMRWEALAVNADFWSQVLQAQTLRPLDFALGAVMATTRTELEGMGGFAALVEYLADDYQLGRRIAARGSRIQVCPVVVECRSAPAGWKNVWAHQLRWARTIRVCRPGSFFFSVLSNGTVWPLLWVAWDGTIWSVSLAGFFWLTRVLSARSNQRRMDGHSPAWRDLWLVPVKDFFGLVIWLLAFAGNRIVWRGLNYRLRQDGRLAGPL